MVLITLTTDFGSLYPAALRAVILQINESANIIDITHSIPPGDIRAGAFALYSFVEYFPKGTVHVAVVDPGVGTRRRPIAISAGGQYFVGPDNGLLIPAARKLGQMEIYDIMNQKLLCNLSSTFHGRDIFAPVGAYLSGGMQLEDVGNKIDDFVDMDSEKAEIYDNTIKGEVIFIDDFGNIITNIPKDMILKIADLGTVLYVSGNKMPFLRTYGMVGIGDLLALIGSHCFLEISVNQGNASRVLKIKNHDTVTVRPLEKRIR
ncbi:MAG: S-adenosyl-l-methionine hydroxide adenosyltransferase family protein [Methanosarcinaceae archaeon]|nr:S-adenosyl-l-methionine hydroxide adenosyltransferase family protein [Methanosarcinaceae archaeon]